MEQRQLSAEKIGHAGLPLFLFGVRIIGGGKHLFWRQLAGEEAHHRRGRRLHVQLRCGLRQTAQNIVALLGKTEPKGHIGVFRVKFACLLESELRLER